MSRFSDRYAVRKSAAVRRKRLLTQAFCRHSIQYEGAPAPSYSPCKKELLSFKQRIFDKLKAPGPMVRGPCDLFYSLLNASMGFSRAAFLAGR